MGNYSAGKFYTSRVQWQGQDNYLLWLTAEEKDMYWPDNDGQVPAFATAVEVVALTKQLSIDMYGQEPVLQNLDVVWEWLQQPAKRPPKECLMAWHIFSDLSSGVQYPFSGDAKSLLRNRLFDKLYLNDGIFQINQHRKLDFRNSNTEPSVPSWTLQERKVLKRILQEGFRMWHKYVYWSNRNHLLSGT
jgi:hypothetical protein